jgi:PAS domain S-box-containing protein
VDDIPGSRWPFDRLPAATFETEAGGLIRHANRHWLDMLGLDLETVQGQPLTGFMTEAARNQHLRILRDAIGDVCELESQFLSSSGKVVEVMLSYSIDRDEDGAHTGILGVMIDLTVRRAAEREAASTAALLQSVVTHASDAILITEAELLDAPDGPRVRYVNPAFTAMTGYSAADICGKTACILYGPRTSRRALDKLCTALKTRKPARVELVNYAKDGRAFDAEVNVSPVTDSGGDVTHWVAIQRDVTSRRELERKRLRAIVDGAPHLMWRSSDSGRWTWANPQWCDFTGQSLQESLDHGWRQMIHPADLAATRKAWRSSARNGVIDFDLRIKRASDGVFLWHRIRVTRVCDANDQAAEWIGTATDIEDLKQLQRQQRILLAELQHRTRNLLAVVHAISQKTIRRSKSLQEFATKFLSRLSALSRMQGLLTRTSEGTLDLRQLVELELDSHAAVDPSRIQVAGPAVRVGAAPARVLALALHELTHNAVNHGALGQPSGRLAIDWAIDDVDGERSLAFEWRESGIVIPSGPDIQESGFGREIIEEALPYELDAKTNYRFDPDGVRCSISIPLTKAPEE